MEKHHLLYNLHCIIDGKSDNFLGCVAFYGQTVDSCEMYDNGGEGCDYMRWKFHFLSTIYKT